MLLGGSVQIDSQANIHFMLDSILNVFVLTPGSILTIRTVQQDEKSHYGPTCLKEKQNL